MHPTLPVTRKLQQKILFVASVRDMPDMVRHEKPIGSRHFPLPCKNDKITALKTYGPVFDPENQPIA